MKSARHAVFNQSLNENATIVKTALHSAGVFRKISQVMRSCRPGELFDAKRATSNISTLFDTHHLYFLGHQLITLVWQPLVQNATPTRILSSTSRHCHFLDLMHKTLLLITLSAWIIKYDY